MTSQVALFDLVNPEPDAHSPWTPTTERDRIVAAVAQRVDDEVPTFRRDAEAFVLAYLESHGPTSGEVVSLACKAAGITPHDDRAFGPVYMALSRRGQIVKVGYAPRERGHGTSGAHIWARGKA